MSQLGLGVMINLLGGNKETAETFSSCIGKKITALSLGKEDNALHFVFEDGIKMCLFDDGQSCCESRYMRTDDKLKEYVGAKLLGVEIKPAPSIPSEEEHEVQFLDVKTSKGTFQMASHNEWGEPMQNAVEQMKNALKTVCISVVVVSVTMLPRTISKLAAVRTVLMLTPLCLTLPPI